MFTKTTQGFSLINSGQNNNVLNNRLPPISTPMAIKVVSVLLKIKKSSLIVMRLNINNSYILSDQ